MVEKRGVDNLITLDVAREENKCINMDTGVIDALKQNLIRHFEGQQITEIRL